MKVWLMLVLKFNYLEYDAIISFRMEDMLSKYIHHHELIIVKYNDTFYA